MTSADSGAKNWLAPTLVGTATVRSKEMVMFLLIHCLFLVSLFCGAVVHDQPK